MLSNSSKLKYLLHYLEETRQIYANIFLTGTFRHLEIVGLVNHLCKIRKILKSFLSKNYLFCLAMKSFFRVLHTILNKHLYCLVENVTLVLIEYSQ